jgi:hypothetical protein
MSALLTLINRYESLRPSCRGHDRPSAVAAAVAAPRPPRPPKPAIALEGTRHGTARTPRR